MEERITVFIRAADSRSRHGGIWRGGAWWPMTWKKATVTKAYLDYLTLDYPFRDVVVEKDTGQDYEFDTELKLSDHHVRNPGALLPWEPTKKLKTTKTTAKKKPTIKETE